MFVSQYSSQCDTFSTLNTPGPPRDLIITWSVGAGVRAVGKSLICAGPPRLALRTLNINNIHGMQWSLIYMTQGAVMLEVCHTMVFAGWDRNRQLWVLLVSWGCEGNLSQCKFSHLKGSYTRRLLFIFRLTTSLKSGAFFFSFLFFPVGFWECDILWHNANPSHVPSPHIHSWHSPLPFGGTWTVLNKMWVKCVHYFNDLRADKRNVIYFSQCSATAKNNPSRRLI